MGFANNLRRKRNSVLVNRTPQTISLSDTGNMAISQVWNATAGNLTLNHAASPGSGMYVYPVPENVFNYRYGISNNFLVLQTDSTGSMEGKCVYDVTDEPDWNVDIEYR